VTRFDFNSFLYNKIKNLFVNRFRNDIHVVHFAGALKPWNLTYNSQNEQLSGNLSGQNDIQRQFFLSWWRTMYQHVWPQLSKFNEVNTFILFNYMIC
jgi:lipopolysaccharide biosynthesis glycosyltransferase